MNKKYFVINAAPEYRADLENLPWNIPLNDWTDKGAKFLEIRKGISKHIVRFIKTKDENGKSHTELKAFLSDAETIQILKKISDEFINKDLKCFYDSIGSILKQIEEQKWYLSEKSGNEVDITFASTDWIKTVYNPIIKEFNRLKIFDYFPNTNSVKLYTDSMAHKYYLSIENGKDVGIYTAIRSYSERHSDK